MSTEPTEKFEPSVAYPVSRFGRVVWLSAKRTTEQIEKVAGELNSAAAAILSEMGAKVAERCAIAFSVDSCPSVVLDANHELVKRRHWDNGIPVLSFAAGEWKSPVATVRHSVAIGLCGPSSDGTATHSKIWSRLTLLERGGGPAERLTLAQWREFTTAASQISAAVVDEVILPRYERAIRSAISPAQFDPLRNFEIRIHASNTTDSEVKCWLDSSEVQREIARSADQSFATALRTLIDRTRGSEDEPQMTAERGAIRVAQPSGDNLYEYTLTDQRLTLWGLDAQAVQVVPSEGRRSPATRSSAAIELEVATFF